MRSLLGFLALSLLLASQAFGGLWDIPSNLAGSETVRSYQQGTIKVEEVYYQSRPYQGKPVKIFGYFCYPSKAKDKLPAILLVHGGGGTASLGRSVLWASRGYAVLTIDLPGKGEKRIGSRSTGPDMDVPVLLQLKPDPSYNYLVHAVAAARNGITYLAQRKEVDPERIGMVGLSWGGVVTLLTNGQDSRLKTAVNVFGAGYIPEGCTWQDRFTAMSKPDLEEWYAKIDPKNFLASQHAPILFITGTNDHCYYLPTFQKSYDEVTASKKLILIPNLRHQFFPYMQSIVWTWLDDKLKYEKSFPEINILPAFERGKHRLIIPVTASANSEITRVTLYYASGAPSQWTRKKWLSLYPHYEEGAYYFGIPVSLINPEMLFYITVQDNKGAAASTPIRSIFKLRLVEGENAYAITSPIKKIYIHEPPLQLIGADNITEPLQIYFSKENQIYQILRSGGS